VRVTKPHSRSAVGGVLAAPPAGSGAARLKTGRCLLSLEPLVPHNPGQSCRPERWFLFRSCGAFRYAQIPGSYYIVRKLHKMAPRGEAAAGAALARMFELGVRLTEAMDQGLGEQGLTRSRAEVIWRLQHLGPVSQRALSEALRCTPRNVTGLVDALEVTGHVARRPHPTDRRATLVTLTERGRATAVAWQCAHQELAARALAGLGQAQIADLIEALDHVLGNLQAAGLGPMEGRHG
jgi:DNA-binding MarR family transcriptional regulator